MDPINAFSNSYFEARGKFLELVERKGAKLFSRLHPSRVGADGEDLAIDIAIFGNPEAERTLLLISGTHGQEGYTGSAIQVAFLDEAIIPEGVNIVVLHALNPWGFSHLSRTDENNVDVNRNFRDFSEPLPENSIYELIHPALCPDQWNENSSDWRLERDRIVAENGWATFLSGFTGGQFQIKDGLSYGGIEPSWTNTTVTELLPLALKNSRKIAFIEWHTGLGDYGELCHICLDPPSSTSFCLVFKWLGREAENTMSSAYNGSDGATPSYQGTFSTWLSTALPNALCAGLAIEVGTYDNDMVADALRIDRWLKFGRGSVAQKEELRAVMMERLYPSDLEWRKSAVQNGINVQACFLSGVAKW